MDSHRIARLGLRPTTHDGDVVFESRDIAEMLGVDHDTLIAAIPAGFVRDFESERLYVPHWVRFNSRAVTVGGVLILLEHYNYLL